MNKTILALMLLIGTRASMAQDCPIQGVLAPTDSWQTVSSSYASGGSSVFEITLELGVYYTFKTGCGDGATADHGTVIELLTPLCDVIIGNDDGCENGTTLFNFDNSFFDGMPLRLRVRGALEAGGSFTLAYRSVGGTAGSCNVCPAYDEAISPSSMWQTASSSYGASGCKVYRILVDAGVDYTFQTGCDEGATADHDTFLELRGVGCAILAADDDACELGRSRITWTATNNGILYLQVNSASGGAGSFTLAYRSSGGNGTACGVCTSHDFSITPSYMWGTSTSSHLADGCQIYRVNVTAGFNYTFKTGCGNNATADHDTRLELFNAGCDALALDDEGCEDGRSRIDHVALADGLLYLKVSGSGASEVFYTLAYRRSGTCSACPSYDAVLTPSDVWQTAPASYANEGCKVYRVSVTAGNTYVFKTACGDGASSDHDTRLELMDGTCTVIGTNTDACEGYGARLHHVASITEDIFVKVTGTNGASGSFTLAYKDLGVATNDDCSTSAPIHLSDGEEITITGDAAGATADGDFQAGSAYQGLPVIWQAIELETWCTYLMVSYCEQDPAWSSTLEGIATTCAPDTLIASITWEECTDGNSSYVYGLHSSGTYYVPVLFDPANGENGIYHMRISTELCGLIIEGIQEGSTGQWTVYPNPNNGRSVLLNGSEVTITSVQILDATGRLITNYPGPLLPGSTLDLDRQLDPGTYILHLIDGDKHISEQKIVVQ